MNHERTITRIMEKTFEEIQNEMIVYSYNDFQRVLSQIKTAKNRGMEYKGYAKLYQMLSESHIDFIETNDICYYEKLINDSIEKSFDEEQVVKGILHILFKQFQKFPSPYHYMNRMVTFLYPKYPTDSLRLRILKGLIDQEYGDFLPNSGISGKEALDQYMKYKYSLDNPTHNQYLACLDEEIFNYFLNNDHQEHDSLAAMIEFLESLKYDYMIKDGLVIKGKENSALDYLMNESCFQEKLKSIFTDFVYENSCGQCSLEGLKQIYTNDKIIEFKKLEKNFKGILNQIFYRNKNGKENSLKIKYIDDVKKFKKRKHQQNTCEIVEMADMLANGQFKSGGKTKQYLYLFAIAFHMTYCAFSDEIPDYNSDIEINLFNDYYQNNFMRYLEDVYKNKNNGAFASPEGFAINYRNYAEMIYLYYLCQKNMSSSDKIKKANEMINMIANEKLTDHQLENDPSFDYKQNTVNKFYSNEKEFYDYLHDHYDFKHNQNHLMIESNQKEAYLQYEKIIQKIKELNDGNLKDLNYGLWFIDMKFDDLEKQYSNQMTEQNDDFILLLKKVDSYLRKNFKNYDKKEVLFNSHTSNSLDSLSITRTDLIASYYYYYNLMNTSEKTFNETFYDFKESIKSYLEQAHYQPISKKNIFDVLVILSAYSYQKI